MPYDLRIVRSREFVRLDAQGHFDVTASRQLLSDLLFACARSRIGRIMLDVRDATADLTVAQLSSLAQAAREVNPPPDEHRIAILTRPEVQFDRATALAGAAQDNGWNIEAFHGFEESFDWLSA